MSEAVEACRVCGWRHRLHFRYHGGVPVEHPICPSCGGDLTWSYHFDAAEVQHPPDIMAGFIQVDEVGFPEDNSPEVIELRDLVEACLMARFGSPVPITNASGVVDIEVRPYLAHAQGEVTQGMKLIAHVGSSVYSMALLELLAQLNGRLEVGAVVPSSSTYGVPIGVTELLPFGTDVGLYFQHVIAREELEEGDWSAIYDRCAEHAVELARRWASTARLGSPAEAEAGGEGAAVVEPASDEFSPAEPIALEKARQVVLEPLFEHEHLEEEIVERVESFLDDLELEPTRDDEGSFVFSLDSARIRVSVERRQERLLVRYHAVVLSNLSPAEDDPNEAETISRLLTTLNDQIVFGRCVLEVMEGEEVGHVVLEKTLLATDLDLSEFAITLAFMAEEADRADNFFQEGLGGLRADQRIADDEATALEPLLRRLVTAGLPGFERLGREEGMIELRHLLEEVRLPIEERESGLLAFTYGSSRITGRVWEDERATYLTLRATVLRDVEETAGLAGALNACNSSIHFGAFALTTEGDVEMVETIIIDDLSIEEFIYALVTLGELADTYDNMLQERFGGVLGVTDAP